MGADTPSIAQHDSKEEKPGEATRTVRQAPQQVPGPELSQVIASLQGTVCGIQALSPLGQGGHGIAEVRLQRHKRLWTSGWRVCQT